MRVWPANQRDYRCKLEHGVIQDVYEIQSSTGKIAVSSPETVAIV